MKTAAVTASALALLVLSSASEPAEARRRHHGQHGGVDLSAPGQLQGDRQRTDGAYYSPDPCYWLARRAIVAGSLNWWDRYYSCLGGYRY